MFFNISVGTKRLYHSLHFRVIPIMAWLGLYSAFVSPATAQDTSNSQTYLKAAENLKVEGIPPIPTKLAERVRKYTEFRGASILDWHPANRSMLVSTRFGNSNQVHRVREPGGDRYQLTFFEEPVGSASYDPVHGNYFLMTKDVGGNEFSQIYRHDVASGESVLLTDGGRSQNGGWCWNHKNNLICYSSTRRNGTDRDVYVMDPLKPSTDRLLFQLKGGGWSVQDWSVDEKTLILRETISVNKSILYVANLESSVITPLTDKNSEVSYGSAEFSSDGKSIFYTSDKGGEFQKLFKHSIENGTTTALTDDIEADVESFHLTHDRTKISFVVNRKGLSDIYVFDTLSTTRAQVPNVPVGVATLGPWNHNDSEFAVTMTSPKSTSDVYSVDAKTWTLTRWTESEMGGLPASDLPEASLIEWKSFDEKLISGFLYTPPKRFEGKRPVIINIHGGPEGQSRPTFLGRNNYFINELGCAMIFPNVRGSVGYGKSFVKLDNGLLRLDSVKDIGALLDWIKASPSLDASRVMITGGSYGGYMTLACAVEYNDRIKCSLDVVGISHFGTFLKNTESYRRDLRRVEYGDERDPKIAEFFEETAPLNNSHKITKPLFIVQGGNDPRVPLSEAEQMVAKAKANNSPVWYLMARDEGHGFRKKNNADFQFYSTVLFIEEHLLQ